MKYLAFTLLAAGLFIAACDGDSNDVSFSPEVLESETLFKTIPASETKAFLSSTGLPIGASNIRYDVSIYKVNYKTEYKGATITASGLVALPNTSDPVGIVSFQHGTISAHDEAPTATASDDDILNFYAALASVGFVGVVPDFIGFGSSKDILHPYYVEEPTADAVLDNVRAARELALLNGATLNNKVFLAGYSQGGYATMAAHKAIEEGADIGPLELAASFPAAGGYHIKGVQEYFFSLDRYHEPFYIAYVAMAYRTHYEWEQGLDLLFREPYASRIPGLFDGTKTGGQINDELTENMNELLQAEAINTLDSDSKYGFVVDAFNENSLTDWAPTVPMYLYHGTLDNTVPYQNSVDTYNIFIQNGASPQVVSFTPLPFATHATGITPYIVEITNRLLALK